MSLRRITWAVLATMLVGLAHAGDYVGLLRYGFDLAQGAPALDPAWQLDDNPSRESYRHFLIHLTTPLNRQVHGDLQAAGVEVVTYVPTNCFVVRVYDDRLLKDAPFVDWFGPWQPAYKLAQGLEQLETRRTQLRLQGLVLDLTLHSGVALNETEVKVEALGIPVLDALDALPVQRLRVRINTPEQLHDLAFLEDVAWICETVSREMRNDRARWLVQSYEAPGPATRATPLYDQGLHGEGEVIGLIDQTPDLNHCLLSDPEGDLPGPHHRKFASFTSAAPAADHGTHVAGTLAGIHSDGSLDGAGVAYRAKIAFTVLPGSNSNNLFSILADHAAEGAAVHSNSWGASSGSPHAQEYTVDCVDADNFSWLNEDALVVFACWNDNSFPLSPILSPENALNVLAVGATEAGDVPQPEDLAERHGSCAMGPVALDARRKPEIFAPGRMLLSAKVNTACDLIERGGTSMATPVVSASAALIRQYLRSGFYPKGRIIPGNQVDPSGALLKALLLVGSVDMLEETENSPGVFTNQPIPNDIEGWGRIHLDNSLYFYGDDRHLQIVDVRHQNGPQTGESQTFSFRNLSGDLTLNLCLVFTQPPGSLFTLSPVTNDLDLIVTSPTGQLYLGNVFSGGYSQTGGSADPRNNVEMVRIATPEEGIYQVEVRGTAVNQGPQGFALAMTGDLVAADCEDVQIDAGADVQLECWGDQVSLGSGIPVGLSDSVSWTPTTGLSDANARAPMAQPLETTTYQVTVTLPGGCVKTDDVTVKVPAMNVDGNGVLDSNDFMAFLGAGVWGDIFSPDLNFDYSGEGRVDIRDLLLLLTCSGFIP